jgi:hypothetical protein
MTSPRICVESLSALREAEASLWVSCHGYESRSAAHLGLVRTTALRKLSCGFDFPASELDSEAGKRVADARARLRTDGFDVPVVDDPGFDALIREELGRSVRDGSAHIVADISSMNRARIASLLLACADLESGCDLEILYFPGSYETHKHVYEPLEYFGPCHSNIAGWPSDPEMPLSLMVGIGTEPRRADGVIEIVKPDILAVFLPLGDEDNYVLELHKENRRILEVCGQPVTYILRDPSGTYQSLRSTGARLSERSRLVIVPLGPKIFCVIAIAVALSIGPEVGVWKASAGRGVQPVDVQSHGAPILLRIVFNPG